MSEDPKLIIPKFIRVINFELRTSPTYMPTVYNNVTDGQTDRLTIARPL